ncbi:MAG: hypothetical protein K0U93_29945, partial [Gammaproteobacteria bacterium]|nr:hypothetical protein [Gammaproteobacteria bacterium]
MVSRSKLYARLDALELELKEKLVPHLEQAADGKNDLVFCAEGYNPFQELNTRTDKLTEELIHVGTQILSLKTKLGESSEGSIAERICWYCYEWGNVKNHHRNSTKELARQFLDEISTREDEPQS